MLQVQVKSSLITAGFEREQEAIFIDQKLVHASNRSNLLTYLDIFDDVRSFFSQHTGLKRVCSAIIQKVPVRMSW